MKWLPIHVIGAVLVSSCHHTPDAGENRNKTIVAEPKDSDKTRLSSTISDHDTTLILNYQAISCSCAQWGSAQDRDATDHVYLERDNADLTNADTLWRGDNIPLQIRVKGRYVSKRGYPEGYNPAKGAGPAARVFRYYSIDVLKNGASK